MGTRFVATLESTAHPFYKQAVLDATEADTVYTRVFSGGWPDAPHRVLRNSTVERSQPAASPGTAVAGPGAGAAESSTAVAGSGEAEVIARYPGGAPIVRYSAEEPLAGMEGELEAMALYAGQSAALVHDVPSASDLVPDLVNQSGAILADALASLGRGTPAAPD
jgi:nitronate monooxygenase